jgi:hypothetical protein
MFSLAAWAKAELNSRPFTFNGTGCCLAPYKMPGTKPAALTFFTALRPISVRFCTVNLTCCAMMDDP